MLIGSATVLVTNPASAAPPPAISVCPADSADTTTVATRFTSTVSVNGGGMFDYEYKAGVLRWTAYRPWQLSKLILVTPDGLKPAAHVDKQSGQLIVPKDDSYAIFCLAGPSSTTVPTQLQPPASQSLIRPLAIEAIILAFAFYAGHWFVQRRAQASRELAGATGRTFRFRYTNYRGETNDRAVNFLYFWYGSTDWHNKPQILLHGFDLDKAEERDFALKDIEEWLD
jgi:hypothetical protein